MKLRSTMKRAYRTTWSGIVSIVAAESVAQARQPTQAEFGTQNAAEFGNRCNTRRDGGRRFLDTHDKVDDMGRQRAAAWRAGECRHGERRGSCQWCGNKREDGMQSEVRKVLNSCVISSKVYDRLDAAERADSAKHEEHEEPVQELRRKVSELVARWEVIARLEIERPTESVWTATVIRQILTELDRVIATKPDTVDNRQATASGPVLHESVWLDGKNVTLEKMLEKAKHANQWREIKPVIEPAVAEKVYEIAAKAVRDAMPDVLDGLAKTLDERGYMGSAKAFREHADKLRKERGS